MAANEALREVRLALLEADVNFKVVKDFIARVREQLERMPLSSHLLLNPVTAELAERMALRRAELQGEQGPD